MWPDRPFSLRRDVACRIAHASAERQTLRPSAVLSTESTPKACVARSLHIDSRRHPTVGRMT
ncbi:hypothetical protein BVI1335_530044 [Burkholderia vietnamiensis]|nr:hypothetical protein BVI1335_530044 [Burkholderia vietnamiensis]